MNEDNIGAAMHDLADGVKAESTRAQAIIDELASTMKDGVATAGDQASAAVNTLSEGAVGAIHRARKTAGTVGRSVEPFLQDRPYAALAISAALGLVVGLLMTHRSGKVIRVRQPRDPNSAARS